MKKHFLPICSLFCITIASGYNVYQSQSKVPMSDIIKANIEALSSEEEGTQHLDVISNKKAIMVL